MTTDLRCAKACVLGLERSLASELLDALKQTACEVADRPEDAQIVFCSWDPKTLKLLRRERSDLPVVVVSPLPDVNGWLDALEAGATDYCAAPFEKTQIRWILESNLGHPQQAFAAA